MPINPVKRVRQLLESIALCLGFVLFPFLPRRAVVGLSSMLGKLAFRFGGRAKAVALANLRAAYCKALSDEEAEVIARHSFVTSSRVAIDFFWFAVFRQKRCARWVRFDSSFDSYFKTTPAIAVTLHMGNWEVMAQAVALRGYPYTAVAATLRNPFINRVLNSMRRGAGQEIVKKDGAVRAVISTLRQDGRTIVLPDQNTVPRDGGVFVDFFGLPVPMSKITHVLAGRTAAPVVFIYCVACDDGSYLAYARDPIDIKKVATTELESTQMIAATCEEIVREHPDQWCWMYKRWRFLPPGHSGEGYPYYRCATPQVFL